jgi:hypothetical protein
MDVKTRRNACNVFNALCFVWICGFAHAHSPDGYHDDRADAARADANAANTLGTSIKAGGIATQTLENQLLGAPASYLDPYVAQSGYARTLPDGLLGVQSLRGTTPTDRALASVPGAPVGTRRAIAGAVPTDAAAGGIKANRVGTLAQPDAAARQVYGGSTSPEGGRHAVYRSPW